MKKTILTVPAMVLVLLLMQGCATVNENKEDPCDSLSDNEAKNECYWYKALKEKDNSLCDNLANAIASPDSKYSYNKCKEAISYETDGAQWKLKDGKDAIDGKISYKGNGVLEGWIIYDSYYDAENVPKFHVADVSKLPPTITQSDYFLKSSGTDSKKGEYIPQDFLKELEGYDENNMAKLKVDGIDIEYGASYLDVAEVLKDEVENKRADNKTKVADSEFYMTCANNKFPFKVDEAGGGHGQFTFTGKIIQEMVQRPWSTDENDLIPVVSMIVSKSDIKEAMDFYKDMINEGNTVNSAEDEALKFRLGTYENETFSSTAKISDEILQKILKAMNDGSEISLTFTQATMPGMDAPVNFSFACEIE